MAVSQNGWPVVGREKIVDKAVLGVEFPNGWLRGDVDTIFTELIEDLDKIEEIDHGSCWGWFVKNIEGSGTISNHASGTAIDYNARNHPMGKRNTYSESKRRQIRTLLSGKYDGVIRWGGDYTGRPDDMHFEIVGNMAAVKRIANKIKEKVVLKMRANAIELDGLRIPILYFGEDDDKYAGYDMVRRAQKLLGITADGIYGNDTVKAVKDLMGDQYTGNGKKIDLDVWRQLMGLTHVA